MGKKIQCIGRYTLEGQLLGKGSFARVELAHHSIIGCKVAIKIIDSRKLKEEYQKNNMHRESRIMGQLRHPNIVRLYETLKATTLHCLVMEYASGGELQAFIKLQKDFRLTEDRGRPYIRQLVSALHYLHERGVAHRDLKMENIMLDTPKKNIKLIDFGLSNTFSKDELMKTHCGSPEYAAPELFLAGEKYGVEVDIWSMGITMYTMLVGKLPFTTLYTDQYRRQKLVQQMEKGLGTTHVTEMAHLTPECIDLLKKLLEPTPSLRLPLLDMEIHSWLTENAKVPFFPFQSFPKDRAMKMQESLSSTEEEESSIDIEESLDELAIAMNIKKDVIEQKVAENKSDELSAMFNMIMDRKRQQKGIFDTDHTLKSEKKETKGRRSKSAHAKSDKQNIKGPPPALVFPADEGSTVESAPHSGNDQDHETKFSSFDFLALCSTPTWLGPERRKSRRRSRSPMPSPHIQAVHGLSVRSQMKRDFLERQAIEMEREILREERAAHHAEKHGSKNDLQQQHGSSQQQENATSANDANSGNETPSQSQLAFRRNSSFRFSRRRARSCGPSHRRKSSFQRTGSVDVPADQETTNPEKSLSTSLATTKEGCSAPLISGEDGGSFQTSFKQFLRRKASLGSTSKLRKNSTTESSKPNMLSPSHSDSETKQKASSLSVPSEKKNLLKVPVLSVNKNFLTVPDAETDIPESLPTLDNFYLYEQSSMNSNLSSLKSNSIPRPGNLLLKECYPLPKDKEEKVSHKLKKSSHPPKPPTACPKSTNPQPSLLSIKPVTACTNGPLTNVEVHYEDNSNPSSTIDLLDKNRINSTSSVMSRLQVPNSEMDSSNNSQSSSPLETSDLNLTPDLLTHMVLSEKSTDTNLSKDKSSQPLLSNPKSFSSLTPPLTSILPPKNHIIPKCVIPNNLIVNNVSIQDEALAMQKLEDKSTVSCTASENRVLIGAECSPLSCDTSCKDDVPDSSNHLDKYVTMSAECVEESEDRVDSMTELISDSFRHEIITKTGLNSRPNSGSSYVGRGATPKVSLENLLPSPDEDTWCGKPSSRRGSGSIASISKSSKSGSGRRSSGGKLKSPTTPNWVVLKTPLARIESFHSDDFECLAESEHLDGPSSPSASSMSVTTPTVPCFAYKLHMMKKKQSKLKNNNSKNSNNNNNNENSSKLACEEFPTKLNHNNIDGKLTSGDSPMHKMDSSVMDPLLSSGSETEHHEDAQDRLGAPGKSKIHPMGTEKEVELLSKQDNKCIPYTNAITRQPNQVKNTCKKCPKIMSGSETSGKKRLLAKNIAWKKSFAQFLRRKRCHHNAVPTSPQHHHHHRQQQQQQQHQQPQQQQQQQNPSPHNQQQQPTQDQVSSLSNNNNNDLGQHVPQSPPSRNGTSTLTSSQPSSNKPSTDSSTRTENCPNTGKEGLKDVDSTDVNPPTLPSVLVEPSITELIELQSSPPLPLCSPSHTARVFNFTMNPDSHKVKSSCLFGWGSCRDCGRGNASSEEDIECYSPHDPAVILQLKPLGENNPPQDNTNFTQTFQFSPT